MNLVARRRQPRLAMGQDARMRSLTLVTTVLVLALAPRAHAQSAPGDQPPPPQPAQPPAPPPPAPPPAPPPHPAPAPVAVEPAEPEHEHEHAATGFAIELGLETVVLPQTNVSGGSTVDIPLVAPTLFLGYRLRRITLGIGLDLIRVDQSTSQTMATTTTTTDMSLTNIEVAPGIRVVALESADHKTELLGVLDLGYIAQSTGGTANNAGMSQPTASEYIVQGGVGLERWLAPSFAIGATAGIRYDLTTVPESTNGLPPGTSGSQSVSTTAMFAAFQITAVL